MVQQFVAASDMIFHSPIAQSNQVAVSGPHSAGEVACLRAMPS